MMRFVAAEWLDDLPADAPAAIGSRRDIERLNAIMGNIALMRRLIERAMGAQAPKRIIELGAGDGLFALALAETFAPRWPQVELILVDAKPAMQPATLQKFNDLGWRVNMVTADVFDWLGREAGVPSDLIFANLFLHQFTDEPLTRLLSLCAAHTERVVACEPRRGLIPWLFSCCVGVIGCNAVTRHDAPASVRAGFSHQDLTRRWPAHQRGEWSLSETRAKLFSHTLLAKRKALL